MLTTINKFFDYFLCLIFFPSGIRILPLIFSGGLHSISEKFFLFLLPKNIPLDGKILEIGSYKGASSLLLSLGNLQSSHRSEIYLIEPHPLPDRNQFLNLFVRHGLDKDIKLIEKRSQEAVHGIQGKFRFIFIDGEHTYDQVKTDLSLFIPFLAEGGIVAIHDYDREGVIRAVDEYMSNALDLVPLGLFTSIYYAVKKNRSNQNFKRSALLTKLNRLNALRENLLALENKIIN